MRGWRRGALAAALLSLWGCSSERTPSPAGDKAPVSVPESGGTAAAARRSRIPQPRVEAAGDQVLPAGGTARLVLRVSLPTGLHVQSNAPRDANLIPTVLNVTAPEGLSIVSIRYPEPVDFIQATQLLAVYQSEFEIIVTVRAAASASRGAVVVPADLRYQACNDAVCFLPANTSTFWRIQIT